MNSKTSSNSNDLCIRRQNYAKQIRSNQLQQIKNRIRVAVIHQQSLSTSVIQEKAFTRQQAERLTLILRNEDYNEKALIQLLQTLLEEYSQHTLSQSIFLSFLTRCLHSYFNTLKASQKEPSFMKVQIKHIKTLCEKLIIKIMSVYSISPQNNQTETLAQISPLTKSAQISSLTKSAQISLHAIPTTYFDYFHDQFLKLISLEDLSLFNIWEKIALIRSQIFYERMIQQFLSFVSNVDLIYGFEDVHVEKILKILCSFTVKYQATSNTHNNHQQDHYYQYNINTTNHIKFFSLVLRMIDQFQLGDDAIQLLLDLLTNIYKSNALMMKAASKMGIFQKILEFVNPQYRKQLKSYTIQAILLFFSDLFHLNSDICRTIFLQNQQILSILRSFLPVNEIPYKNSKMISHFVLKSPRIINSTLSTLSNLCAVKAASQTIASSQLYRAITYMVGCQQQQVMINVSYILHNIIVHSEDAALQALYQQNLLDVIFKLIMNQKCYYFQSKEIALKCLYRLLVHSQNFPNHIAWAYNLQAVARCMQYSGLTLYIENEITSLNQQISNTACLIIQMINPSKEQQ